MRPRPITATEQETIGAALLAARQYRPYFGRAIAALSPVAADGLGNIAVDRWWRLYVDFEWFAALSPRLQATSIATHAVEHLLRDHAGRGGSDHERNRVAGDLEIHSHVALHDMAPGSISPQSAGLPTGLLMEEYSSLLPDTGGGGCGGGSGAGCPLESELPASDGAPIDAAAAEAIRDAVAADVRAAASTQGDVPAGLVVWAESRATRYVAPWTTALASSLRRGLSSARAGRGVESYSRLSVRGLARGLVLPGQVRVRARIMVIVDTSGSMAEMGTIVKSIVLRVASDADVTEIVCDVHAQKRRRGGAYLGGGGTDLRSAFALASESRPVPSAIVVITDCCTEWPSAAPALPVTVVRCGGGGNVPSWATAVFAS